MPVRSFAAMLIVAWSALCSSASIHAQTTAVHPNLTRFVGQAVAVLDGKDGAPVALTLETRDRMVAMHISPQARLVPHSAEAQVEGLVTNDYLIVQARHARTGWMAQRIDYDVQPVPVPALPAVLVHGTVGRVSTDGKTFSLVLDDGDIRTVITNAHTRYRMGGQDVDGTGLLVKGDDAQVLMRRSGRDWLALEVTIKATAWL